MLTMLSVPPIGYVVVAWSSTATGGLDQLGVEEIMRVYSRYLTAGDNGQSWAIWGFF